MKQYINPALRIAGAIGAGVAIILLNALTVHLDEKDRERDVAAEVKMVTVYNRT